MHRIARLLDRTLRCAIIFVLTIQYSTMAARERDTWMTVPEVAKYLKFSKPTVYQLAQKGEIPRTKIAGQWRFRRERIDEWADRPGRETQFWADRDLLEQLFERTLGEHLQAGDIPSQGEPVRQVRDKLRHAFMRLHETFNELPIDLLGVELERSYTGASGVEEAQRVRSFSGILADVMEPSDPYPESAPWRFVHWRYPFPLRIRILGDPALVKPESGRFELITHKSVIEGALQSETTSLDDQLTYILDRSYPGNFPSEMHRRAAARVALESTEYSRKLMSAEALDEIGINRRARKKLGLPHADERNIVFLPSFVRGTPIGGAAVFSHEQLPYGDLLLFAIGAHLIVHRFRTADDFAAVQIAAHDQARWEATLIHIRRLSHDVRKPLDLIRSQLAHFIEDTRAVDSDTKELLLRVKEQLDVFGAALASRIGVTTDDLRRQARDDSRSTRLRDVLDSALWIWDLEAAKHGKTVKRILENDDDQACLPKTLVVEVLGNLVSNAVRFARVVVEVHARLKMVGDSREVEFVVKDDGPGMSAEVWSQAFQRALSEGPSLAGQGLYLSRFIAKELLFGELTAKPTGRGLLVRFSFPEIRDERQDH